MALIESIIAPLIVPVVQGLSGSPLYSGFSGVTIVSATAPGADSAVAPGNADTGQAAIIGQGTWGRQTNKYYLVAAGGANFGYSPFVYESGKSDVLVSLDASGPLVSGGGIALRYSDNNNWWSVEYMGGSPSWRIGKFVAGVFSAVATGSATLNNPSAMQVIAVGSNITIYVDGVSVFSCSDSFNAAATKHGMVHFAVNASRFDNLLIQG